MSLYKCLSVCFIFQLVGACESRDSVVTVISSAKEIKSIKSSGPVKEHVKAQKTKPLLDLSLDNITLEPQDHDDIEMVEKNSNLVDVLNRKQEESNISISGKLLIDEDKMYLDSVNGAQIFIQGDFD